MLIEYTGKNFGSETWGGPGAVPSNAYYVFGAGEKDRIKYVRPEDVEYFLNYRRNGAALFRQAQLPVAEPLKLKSIQVGGELTPVGELGGTDAAKEETGETKLDVEAVPTESTDIGDFATASPLAEVAPAQGLKPSKKKVQKFGKSK